MAIHSHDGRQTIDHPGRGRFNAWLLEAIEGYTHRKYGAIKRELLGEVPPSIVELGVGTGANFRYYPRGTRVVAIEPNVRMHEALRRQALRFGLDLELRAVGAEATGLESASADLVVATLVLCSVQDQRAVLAEALRVLRPGGRFVCIEHVIAPARSPIRALQRAIRRPWRWAFEGCDVCRDTATVLSIAGFSRVSLRRLRIPTILLPIRHQIAAECIA